MIPSMEPPIESQESVPIPFDESDPKMMLALDLITEMYVGREHPVLVSRRDGFAWLIIPRTVSKVFPIPSLGWKDPKESNEPLTDKAPSLHGVPSNG